MVSRRKPSPSPDSSGLRRPDADPPSFPPACSGNVAQLGLAVARTYAPNTLRTYEFEKADQQALTSLLAFLVGTSLGRIGDRLGNKSRGWLVLATFAQALCLMAAALCAHFCGQSSFASSRTHTTWTNPTGLAALGFASASLGIQGIIGKRLNTQFATAVVLTTTWCELINDPKLFAVGPSTARDHKVMAVFFLFLGAMISRTLIDVIDSPAVLGIGAGLRVIQVVGWLAVP